MKFLLVLLVLVVVVVASAMPITAYMVRYGLEHSDKPIAGDLVYTAGNLRLKLQQHRSAAAIMQKALATFPKHQDVPVTYFRIGLCYEKLGQTEEAVKWYKSFQAGWPKHEWASQAGKRIANLEAASLKRPEG